MCLFQWIQCSNFYPIRVWYIKWNQSENVIIRAIPLCYQRILGIFQVIQSIPMCLCRGQPRGLTASHHITPTQSAFPFQTERMTRQPVKRRAPAENIDSPPHPKCLHSIEFHSTAAISPALGPNQRETKGMFVGEEVEVEEEERSSLALPRGFPPNFRAVARRASCPQRGLQCCQSRSGPPCVTLAFWGSADD